MRYRNNKAQNFVEYTLILSIIGLALFGMQTYFKRGIQSVIKVTADDLGTQGEPIATKFKSDPQVYAQKIEDQKKIEAATKNKYYPGGNKDFYSGASYEDVTIENKGNGNIVRTTNKATVSSDDISY